MPEMLNGGSLEHDGRRSGMPSYCAHRQASGSLPCPACGTRSSNVIDTRHTKNYTRRRRVCICGYRYTTEERCVDESFVPNFEI